MLRCSLCTLEPTLTTARDRAMPAGGLQDSPLACSGGFGLDFGRARFLQPQICCCSVHLGACFSAAEPQFQVHQRFRWSSHLWESTIQIWLESHNGNFIISHSLILSEVTYLIVHTTQDCRHTLRLDWRILWHLNGIYSPFTLRWCALGN